MCHSCKDNLESRGRRYCAVVDRSGPTDLRHTGPSFCLRPSTIASISPTEDRM